MLFVTVPIVELTLLLWLSHYEGWLVTIGVVLFTGILGTLLARSQGFTTWQKIQAQLAAGQMPGSAVADAAMIFSAGALLMTPGLLTDALGFALLIPPCRQWLKTKLLAWAKANMHIQTTTTVNGQTTTYTNTPGHSQVIDSYVVPKEEPQKLEE
ncbi:MULTISPECIES: FxsA family protein [Bremerella]|uniref:FxsA family protein n=1 Tax=Bremerella TaxID=2714594 RepID=UPI0031E8C269